MPFVAGVALYGAGSALDSAAKPKNNGVNGHGGFVGPGYGKPGSPGYDANGIAYNPATNPAPPPPPNPNGGRGGGANGANGGVSGGGDPRGDAFEWAGKPGRAAADVARYQGMGAAWANQQAPTTDYTQANRYMGMGDQARSSQGDALGMMQQAALGNTPSVAQLQQQQGMQSAIAGQMAMQANARGASGMAQAGYGGAANVAGLQRGGAMDASMLRAQEMANARNAYMQGASGMRGQDLQGQQMGMQMGQYGSDLSMRQRALGQAGQLGFEGMGYNVNDAQMGGQMGLYGAQDAQHTLQVNTDSASQARNGAGAWVDRGINLYSTLNSK